MAGYEVVDPPRGLSYAAPMVDFGIIGNLANDYYQGKQNRRQEDIATAFKDGLPTDPATGQPSYAKMMEILAQKGDIGAISRLAAPQLDQTFQGQAGQMSPLFGGGSSAAPSSSIPAAAAPQSFPARPLGPVVQGGGDSAGSVVDILGSRVSQDSQTFSAVADNIARTVRASGSNVALTPEQTARATQLADAYVQRTAAARPAAPALQPGPAPQPAPAPTQAPPAAPVADTFAQRFAAAGPSDSAQSSDAPPKAPERTGGYVPPPPAPRPAQPAPAQAPQAAPMQAPPVAAAPPPAPAAPQGQPASGQRLTPEVPLPPGYTDPQKAILALRREAARLSTNPRAAGQVKELDAWATRIESSLQPISVGDRILSPTGQTLYSAPQKPMVVGGNLVDPSSHQVVYRGTDQLLPPETITFMAEQYRAGDTSVLQNLGRGAQGSQNIVALREEIARQNKAEGTGGADQAVRNAEYFGTKAGQRTLGTRSANIELAATEFKQVLPIVRQASAAVERTNYPDLNKVIQAFEQKTGDPKIVAFGGGVNTLINLYARAISPTGVPTVSDKDHAREILTKSWAQGQFDAAVGMMEKEIDAALASPEKVRDDMRKRFLGGQGSGARSGSEPATAASGAGANDGWVTRPSGNRVREIH